MHGSCSLINEFDTNVVDYGIRDFKRCLDSVMFWVKNEEMLQEEERGKKLEKKFKLFHFCKVKMVRYLSRKLG
jgi:hypothetical protein